MKAEIQAGDLSFSEQVYRALASVPCGKVVSYGQIAYLLGRPRAARAVGWAMRRCPDTLPWHRVVREDGSIAGGGYAGERRERLIREGVLSPEDDRVDMLRFRFVPSCDLVTDGREVF